jgi:hypothetical protein
VGAPPARVTSNRVRWGTAAPRSVDARLSDGSRLQVTVEEVGLDVALPANAFDPPPAPGYRPVDAEEARGLWGRRGAGPGASPSPRSPR